MLILNLYRCVIKVKKNLIDKWFYIILLKIYIREFYIKIYVKVYMEKFFLNRNLILMLFILFFILIFWVVYNIKIIISMCWFFLNFIFLFININE